MKNLLIICIIFMSNSVWAQIAETPDTTFYTELNEIVIEAQNQRTSATSTTYLPTAGQKKSSSNAISLLNHLSIPQLEVNPVNKTVSSISGQPVTMFIDYLPATPQDLEGLQPRDVKKVEVLLNPTDPRFQGAQNVINFVMQQYAWGGYTKLNVDMSLGINKWEKGVYSKFSYKSMMFDLFASGKNLSDKHRGFMSRESFSFPNFYGGGERITERVSSPISAKYESKTDNLTFRALYRKESIQISNMISFNNTSIPHNDSEKELTYIDNFLPNSMERRVRSEYNFGLNYDHETFLQLRDNLALDIKVSYGVSKNKMNSEYETNNVTIVNNAKELAYLASLIPYLVWNPNRHNSIMLIMDGEYSNINIHYLGNSPSNQIYDIWAYMGGVRYIYRQNKWSAGGLLGYVNTYTNLSGAKIKDNYPHGNVFGSYSPNDRHQIEMSFHFGKVVPETYQKSPNMLQQDELIWYAGNPDLENYWTNMVRLGYLWLLDNRWQFATDSYWYKETDRVISVYYPNGPDGNILRQYVNEGDMSIFMYGLSATGKFLGGKLMAKVHPQFWYRNFRGANHLITNEVTCSSQLTWYFGNFYLTGWYSTPNTVIEAESGIKLTTPSVYQIELGWSKGGWQLTASANNFIRSSWEMSKQQLFGRNYYFYRLDYGSDLHRRFELSVSYTFSYGKKVNRRSEINVMDASKSAILK